MDLTLRSSNPLHVTFYRFGGSLELFFTNATLGEVSGRAQVGERLAPKPQAAEIPYPVHGQVHEQVGLEILLMD